MRFDYPNYDDKSGTGGWGDNGFGFDRARLFLHRSIADGVSFDARWHGGAIDRYWVTMKDFLGAQGVTAKFGSFAVDWMGDDGLYQNNDMWDDDADFMDITYKGAMLNYKSNGFEAAALVYSEEDSDSVYRGPWNAEGYALRLKYSTDKFFVSANMINYNDGGLGYWFAAGFTPFKGVYMIEDGLWQTSKSMGFYINWDSSPNAWKAIIDVSEDVLKFTSLRFEYGKYDRYFFQENLMGNYTWHTGVGQHGGGAFFDDIDVMQVSTVQKWGDKFSTYERYTHYDQNTFGKAKELQIGVGYQYTANAAFYLDWIKMDNFMSGTAAGADINVDGRVVPGENKVVRFRTVVNF